MKIIFCHHAQRKKENPPTQEDGLTKLGIKDAKLTAKIFSNIPNVKAIYTSPFYRCKKTAELVNKHLNVPIILEERFNEFGSVKDENWTQLQNRVISAINDIYNKYEDNDAIICVTSGVNVGAFICWNFGIDPSEKTTFIGISSCSPLVFNKKK